MTDIVTYTKAKEGQITMTAYEDLGITPFDAADYLDSREAQLAFINDAIESGSANVLASALGAVARARSRHKGIGELASKTGIARQTLNKSLGPKGNPTVETLFSVLRALDLRMAMVPRAISSQMETSDDSEIAAKQQPRAVDLMQSDHKPL